MAKSRDIVSPKTGMNTDKAVFDRTNVEYSFALNANFHDEHGTGEINLQNEPSNVLCSGFKDGYKVVGHKYDVDSGKTYFFLTNPTTGCSEIGYIDSISDSTALDVNQDCNGCGIEVTLETPLEDQTQTAICAYTTIITDECNGNCDNTCLGFSIDNPIHESNIVIKREKTGTNMYFNAQGSPRRYLQLDNLDIYTTDSDPCIDADTTVCLDCDKLRVDKLFSKPCVEAVSLQNGGNLRAGTYEIAVAYSTSTGDVISNYYSKTNPVSIYDADNNILDQTNLDYITNKAIKVDITGMDDSYDYYKVAVIYKSGLNAETRVYDHGVYPIDTQSVTISSVTNRETIDLTEIFSRKPFYKSARGLATGGGYLFHYGMESQRDINLQPVVSLMGMFAKWTTVAASEHLYKDGVDVSNYRGYMRDEVYPFAIQFFGEGGYETPLYKFIPRPPKPSELDILGSAAFPDNNSTMSVLEHVDDCDGNDRNRRWQFENTATIEGTCPQYTAAGSTSVTTTEQLDCYVTDAGGSLVAVDTVANGTIEVDLQGQTLITYINQNAADIIASTDPQWAAIKAILSNPAGYTETCTPSFPASCGALALEEEEMQALNTSTEDISEVPDDFDNYIRPASPDSCNAISNGNPEDTAFRDTYMTPSDTVYERNANTNDTCSTASDLVEFYNTPTSQIHNPVVFNYDGAVGSNAALLSGKTSSAAAADFNAEVHSNALWFKVPMTGDQYHVFEMSTFSSVATDSVHTDRVRISVFNDCGDLADIPAYARIVSDINAPDDANKFIELDSNDFPSGTAYIAIDTPMLEDTGFNITLSDPEIEIALTGTSGTANINIDGTDYLTTFNTDLTTTAADFVTTNAGAISGAHNITVTDNAGVLTFSGTGLTNITIANASGDLSGTVTPGEISITIDGNTYSQPFNTDLATTASDFVAAHEADLLANSNITVAASGEDLVFRATTAQYGTLTIDGTSGITGTDSGEQTYYVLTAPGGCINMYRRKAQTTPSVTFTQLTFTKKQVYSATCTTQIPEGLDCEPIPHRYGDFGYYESTIKYPCNKELFDSSDLVINSSDLPTADMRTAFEANYVDTIAGNGDYTLNVNANFRDKPVRHYRFPCASKVPFMSDDSEAPGKFLDSIIYPIGFSIDAEVIRAFLDIAVTNGLLTLEERNRIKRYEIFRGDRTTDKSIIAKGLLFDMYKYNERNGDPAFYSNYPLNAMGPDTLNGFVVHPGDSNYNTQYTFHSPDTHHYQPTLPDEMKIEGYQFGSSAKYWDEVKDHAKFTILGEKAIDFAGNIATAEVTLDIVTKIADWTVLGTTGGISSVAGIIAAVIAGIAHGIGAVIEIGGKRYEWLNTVRNLGQPKNHAYYNATIGFYNYMVSNTDVDNQFRGLPVTQYLTDGRWSVPNETNGTSFDINNVDREESVFLSLGDTATNRLIYPDIYKNYDLSLLTSSSKTGYSGIGRSGRRVGRAASPYVSLKQFVPDQYGSIYSIDWIGTNACGNVDSVENCEVVFGGDIFISRFSVKRKFPFFTTNAHGLAPLTPFKYSDYFNINPGTKFGRYYVDYRINSDGESFGGILFPDDLSEYRLDSVLTTDTWYIEPPAKFYLYYYGFPHFLVESPINNNFRYAKRELHENFYPNFKDVLKYTQESDVSIREPNTFFYNDVYSLTPTRTPNRTLPVDYDRELYDKLNDQTNQTVYSLRDNSEQDLTDPWLVYRPLDGYQFPTSYGKLVDMDGIESEQILGRFENGLTIFGAIDQIGDRFQADFSLGSGSIFAGRNINFNKTDLGYAGTQHVAKVSCEFGHFWADAKRGEVFNLAPNGKGLEQITEGKEKWFKEHLPFKISKYVDGLSDTDLDNTYKGLGITMGWDARLKRVFLTKLDYTPKVAGITFIDGKFYNGATEVFLTDTDVFTNCSFTIAYSPLTKTWISYYSFKPNYYIGYENYFQTGINYSAVASEIGLWSHLSFGSSYQVFYGTRYPFIIDMPVVSKQRNSSVQDIEYWLDVRKYYNKYDEANICGVGMDQAYIYNSYQNTGKLNLVMAEKDNAFQLMNYPKHNSDSIDILQTEVAGKHTFNYIYNNVRNEKSGVPHWTYDCTQVNKELVQNQIDYRPTYKDRIRGDHFSLRLLNTLESRYKMIFRFVSQDRDFEIE